MPLSLFGVKRVVLDPLSPVRYYTTEKLIKTLSKSYPL